MIGGHLGQEHTPDRHKSSIRSKCGTAQPPLKCSSENCRSERPVPEGQGQEVKDRKHEEPLDGEQRFYWGSKGSTQPYTETYHVTIGQWLRDL